jgi:Ca2+-transporting ATPase
VFLALIALGAFVSSLHWRQQGLQEARTVAFTVMVIAQLLHAFSCRSDRSSLFSLGLGTNAPLLWAAGGSAVLQAGILVSPWTREVFKVVPLAPQDWLFACGLGVLPLAAMEGWKAALRWQGRQSPRGSAQKRAPKSWGLVG